MNELKKTRQEIDDRFVTVVHAGSKGAIENVEMRILVIMLTALERATLARLRYEASERKTGHPVARSVEEVRRGFIELLGEEYVP